MDPSSSDLEFFDFKNVTEDEIKEIQAILKGPGSNGCVELPWEIPIKENVIEEFSQDAGTADKAELVVTSKSSAALETVVSREQPASTPLTPPSPPVPRLPPPPVEAFVAPPTTMGPYANTPYFVSRTLPYLRAYTHMGVPFFAACPMSGTGEANPMNSPYGHFVPVVPATAVGQEAESGQKNRERQFNRRSKKKSGGTEYSCDSDPYGESEERTPASPPVSSGDRPTSVPLVPLPVPPQAFGGTLPLHGYPPGLHTQLYGPQAPSMYYVPVFNHYGGYLPSPPSAPVVLPVGLRSEIGPVEEAIKTLDPDDAAAHAAEPTDDSSDVRADPERTDGERVSVSPVAKNSEAEEVTDCNSSSDYPLSKSASSSPDCVSEAVTIAGDAREVGRDPSRCWADLFKKPCPEVNGIDRGHEFDADIANGKLHSVPANSNVL